MGIHINSHWRLAGHISSFGGSNQLYHSPMPRKDRHSGASGKSVAPMLNQLSAKYFRFPFAQLQYNFSCSHLESKHNNSHNNRTFHIRISAGLT